MKAKILLAVSLIIVFSFYLALVTTSSASSSDRSADAPVRPPIYENGNFFLPRGVVLHYSENRGLEIVHPDVGFLVEEVVNAQTGQIQFRAFALDKESEITLIEGDLNFPGPGVLFLTYDISLTEGTIPAGGVTVMAGLAMATQCQCATGVWEPECKRSDCVAGNACTPPDDNLNCWLAPKSFGPAVGVIPGPPSVSPADGLPVK